jgi:hypothetical protein
MVENFLFSFFFSNVAAGYHRKKIEKNKINAHRNVHSTFQNALPLGQRKEKFHLVTCPPGTL